MNLITWILVGGLAGWLASFLLRIERQANVRLNLIVGIIGAIIAGIYITPLFDIETINQRAFSFPSMWVALGGAVVLLLGVYLFRIIKTRTN